MDTTVSVIGFAVAEDSGVANTAKPLSPASAGQPQRIGRWPRALRRPVRRGMLLFACVLIGYWFNAFDDAVSGVGELPAAMWALVYFGGWSGAFAGLTLIASALFQVRKRWIPVGAVFAAMAFLLTMVVFALSPLFGTVGYIYGNETAWQLAGKRFGMLLFLCWGATLIAVGATWYLRGKQIDWRWALGSLAVGAGAALLGGVSLLGRYASWVTHMKWSKFLSTGAMALLFVLLAGALAEGVQSWRGRRSQLEA